MLHRNADGMPVGLITNIQKYTIHDGPGIRTEVFFKGCPLRCLWCSNPETLAPAPQIGAYPNKCLGADKCGLCLKACPLKENLPIRFEGGMLSHVEMVTACAGCLKCTEVCPGRALKRWGEEKTVEELMKTILEDRSFYLKTGGGVTLSGGEVMLQWEFAAMLLEQCKRASVHTCVESALHCREEQMLEVYRFTDLVITDIKHMDTVKHKKYTGAGNELILQNIKKTAALGLPLVIRTPIVAGYNNDEKNIRATGRFIRDELGGRVVQHQLLPYRKMGTEKYDSLNEAYPMADYASPERSAWEENLLRLTDILVTEYGVPAVPGSSKKLPV